MLILSGLGVVLLAVALFDIVVTTITIQGAGPITSRLTRNLWRACLWMHSRRPSHDLLAFEGVGIVVAGILAWVLMLWTAWSLVFLGSGGAIVDADSGDGASFWSTVYFAGYTLFTLGLGDFRPVGPAWQNLTALCAANGLVAITLSVSYLVPVISAAVEKRQLAALISTLGLSPASILRAGNGNSIANELAPLSTLVISQSQKHLAYPVLHYFHSPNPITALSLQLAVLDETVILLRYGTATGRGPRARSLRQVSCAIGLFLQALHTAHIAPADEAPEYVLPQGDDALPPEIGKAFEDALRHMRDRRRLMRANVENDGWTWKAVERTTSDGGV